ncbi:MAG: hypothetical protein AAFR31_10815 [Cyanobacteria bacterium J06627_8]
MQLKEGNHQLERSQQMVRDNLPHHRCRPKRSLNRRPVSSHQHKRTVVRQSSARRRRDYRSVQMVQLRTVMFEAAAWLTGAVVIRVVLNLIMAASSQFWLLGLIVACLPAVTAIWMTYLSPRHGFIVGYRCLLLMTGLLLGGKFQ